MKLNNLIQVKGYEAGKNGNMLVSLDDKLVQDRNWNNGKKEFDIKMLLTTAYVDDPEDQAQLAKYTDGTSPVDRVIVVSKKFCRLFNKTQLILLHERNAREDVVDDVACYEEVESYGRVETYRQFGKFRSKMAFDKERKIMEKDEIKAGKAMHKFQKKQEKQVKKAVNSNKGLGVIFHGGAAKNSQKQAATGEGEQQTASTEGGLNEEQMKQAEELARQMAEDIMNQQEASKATNQQPKQQQAQRKNNQGQKKTQQTQNQNPEPAPAV